ncbi:MAG: RNA polymerase sigma factor [Verrucomicrobia bacterium]|nr:RNA polymerase sigma factor [Verrucomicrobiota bacterium]
MKLPEPDPALRERACAGDLAAADELLRSIQPGVFNLALRLLGQRADAEDATQEILLRVLTHLGSFRGESAFGTWVFRVAKNHLSTRAARSRQHPEIAWTDLGERLAAGLEFGRAQGFERALTPADRTEAREVAVLCTQGMLLRLSEEQRFAYVLDVVFGLTSEQAAEVLEVSSVVFRKRLSRARQEIESFARRTCGLVNENAACRCERQLPAVRATRSADQLRLQPEELPEAEAAFEQLTGWSDAAAVLRAHPAYRAPARQLEAIRALLQGQSAWPGAN